MLVYGKEDSVGQIRSKFSGYIKLEYMVINEVQDVEIPDDENHVTVYRPRHGIFIEAPRKSFYVYAESKEEKQKWLEILRMTIEAHQENFKDERTLNKSGPAAIWVPDYIMKACPLCYKEFSFFTRRHHCRNCGTLVCGNCSNQKMVVLSISQTEAVRVCFGCFRNK